jgi:heat shock protein HslJ
MHYLTLAVIAALLLGACAASNPAPGADITGRDFWSTKVAGHDLAPDTTVALRFGADGSLGASAGCNSMGGTWSMDGAALRINVSSMTEMGCPEDRMAQDEWVVSFLNSGPTAAVAGDQLVLTSAGVTMTLLDRGVADPDRPLAGTDWALAGLRTGVGDDAAAMSVPGGVRSTLRIDGDRLTVDTGCNTGTATVTTDGETLTVGPLALTKRGCIADAGVVEQTMVAALAGPLTIEIQGRALHLTGGAGGLDFTTD